MRELPESLSISRVDQFQFGNDETQGGAGQLKAAEKVSINKVRLVFIGDYGQISVGVDTVGAERQPASPAH